MRHFRAFHADLSKQMTIARKLQMAAMTGYIKALEEVGHREHLLTITGIEMGKNDYVQSCPSSTMPKSPEQYQTRICSTHTQLKSPTYPMMNRITRFLSSSQAFWITSVSMKARRLPQMPHITKDLQPSPTVQRTNLSARPETTI